MKDFSNTFAMPVEMKGRWQADVFKNTNPIVLELGCGRGEYTIGLSELYPEKIISQNKIQVPYQKGKSAKYYIDEYAGGLSKDASSRKISVIDASGKVVKAKNFLFFREYPDVGPGSEIKIGYKDVEIKDEKNGDKEDVKWGDILANSIAQATAILSLILLIQNVN